MLNHTRVPHDRFAAVSFQSCAPSAAATCARGRGVVAERSGVAALAIGVEQDSSTFHQPTAARQLLVATRDVVVGGEDRDATLDVARVVLDLPRFRRADDEAIALAPRRRPPTPAGSPAPDPGSAPVRRSDWCRGRSRYSEREYGKPACRRYAGATSMISSSSAMPSRTQLALAPRRDRRRR